MLQAVIPQMGTSGVFTASLQYHFQPSSLPSYRMTMLEILFFIPSYLNRLRNDVSANLRGQIPKLLKLIHHRSTGILIIGRTAHWFTAKLVGCCSGNQVQLMGYTCSFRVFLFHLLSPSEQKLVIHPGKLLVSLFTPMKPCIVAFFPML